MVGCRLILHVHGALRLKAPQTDLEDCVAPPRIVRHEQHRQVLTHPGDTSPCQLQAPHRRSIASLSC
jgi:hypothetical protein